VVTKWNYGFNSVRTLTPKIALDRLREGTQKALEWMPQARPLKLSGPIGLEIRFASPTTAEALGLLKSFRRLDAYTVAYQAEDVLELSRLLMFLALVQPSLKL
jgi:D-amino peptidase